MRLIDADALMEHIKKLECHAENKKYEQGLNDFLQCYLPQIIDNQPTAYDVENVVEELEEEREYSYADFEEYAESYGLDLSEHDDWYYQGLKRAITLVKRGVVS